MKKIMNDPSQIVTEMVQGLVRSYPDQLKQIPGTEAVMKIADLKHRPQVGIVSGGGSGHEPTHAGFVGDGMLTAAVIYATDKAWKLSESTSNKKSPRTINLSGCYQIV